MGKDRDKEIRANHLWVGAGHLALGTRIEAPPRDIKSPAPMPTSSHYRIPPAQLAQGPLSMPATPLISSFFSTTDMSTARKIKTNRASRKHITKQTRLTLSSVVQGLEPEAAGLEKPKQLPEPVQL